jgi:hypothetical protein
MEVEVRVTDERRQDILEGILGSCFWTWSWWRETDYSEGFDWDTYPEDSTEKFLTLTIADPEADEWDDDYEERSVTKSLSVDDILRAFFECAGSGPSGARLLAQEDAQSGDAVLQWVMFGEIVYG